MKKYRTDIFMTQWQGHSKTMAPDYKQHCFTVYHLTETCQIDGK